MNDQEPAAPAGRLLTKYETKRKRKKQKNKTKTFLFSYFQTSSFLSFYVG
jgi:hypothetical protein